MNLLVVDAQPEFAEQLRSLMGPQNTVEYAANGVDAWMILSTFQHEFDAVVLDVVLPDMDGLDLFAKIRRTPKHRDRPVIVCSAQNHRDTVSKAVALGVRHYLIKPASPESVLNRITAATGKALGASAKIDKVTP